MQHDITADESGAVVPYVLYRMVNNGAVVSGKRMRHRPMHVSLVAPSLTFRKRRGYQGDAAFLPKVPYALSCPINKNNGES
jgi:hypothetical protein